ncbi:MAG: DUF1593 domain-containing protein [Bacteroidales bacterium]|nr:DUF1593 domain-containing protein [Bacteroidales bacterium]
MLRFYRSIPLLICLSSILLAQSSCSSNRNEYEKINTEKHRLIIFADMGNEEDEMQQMMHMLLYSNEFDLEGLIAVSGKFLHAGRYEDKPNHYKHFMHPELFHELIDGYSKVLPNLKKHAKGWPEPGYLRGIVASGTIQYGMKGVGKGMETEGSKLVLKALLKNDSRPVYFVGNAGTNTLAQALLDYSKDHSKEEVDELSKKVIMYENGSQDNSGAWIVSKFPKVHWIRSNYQTYCYMGFKRIESGPYCWQPYPYTHQGQHQWTAEHVQNNHGALGELYPNRFKGNGFLEGGGTTPWLGLITRGLYDPDHPHWGGWSGRYTKNRVKNEWSRHKGIRKDEELYNDFYVFADTVDYWINPETADTFNTIATPIQRWRKDILEDFKGRMDWCVEDFDNANHNPVAVVDGIKEKVILRTQTIAGNIITFDASRSYDPDGDEINYHWWIYREAGTYTNKIKLVKPTNPILRLNIPPDANGKQIHCILEVSDNNNIAKLKDYKRIVINIQ